MNWFQKELELGVKIITSKKGFTNDYIATRWLQHFIDHLDAGPHRPWKLLLIDNYRSYTTVEFV